MKKISGGRRVLRGKINLQTYLNRIQLFDGKFSTGYKLVEFRIIPKAPQNVEEGICVVSTEPHSSLPTTFDFSDNQNVAYAGWGVPNQTEYADWNLVIEDNMIIEDLWVSCYSTGDEEYFNYYMVLEKYDLTDWTGALTMVRNKSQG